ncbi:hypothetical protein ACFPM0_03385 [Pseudonocardia sulfidoxydans]
MGTVPTIVTAQPSDRRDPPRAETRHAVSNGAAEPRSGARDA